MGITARSVIIDTNTTYVLSFDGPALTAFDNRKGTQLWQHNFPSSDMNGLELAGAL